ncbi:hypothetical protein BGW36DRAFT_127406 [Talaromyces proteolyticus]|uniref:Uncharacterized protein n=1 Tax=Talaromyces proteolyticus TaxID=1131652 RepID=A0AAD4KYU8_9EURO|nr:uncharacterized protein BGW36DRAFT_127406 [Talaromyces proteolyticus]KAH8700350.1 hypothetical protein BGW36DRAFT_127406 [Talaromyces proteolyticus]
MPEAPTHNNTDGNPPSFPFRKKPQWDIVGQKNMRVDWKFQKKKRHENINCSREHDKAQSWGAIYIIAKQGLKLYIQMLTNTHLTSPFFGNYRADKIPARLVWNFQVSQANANPKPGPMLNQLRRIHKELGISHEVENFQEMNSSYHELDEFQQIPCSMVTSLLVKSIHI